MQEGVWVTAVLNGPGKVTYPDGSVYEGGFVDGQRQGQGMMRLADGSAYEGAWEEGQPVGPASLGCPSRPARRRPTCSARLADDDRVARPQRRSTAPAPAYLSRDVLA